MRGSDGIMDTMATKPISLMGKAGLKKKSKKNVKVLYDNLKNKLMSKETIENFLSVNETADEVLEESEDEELDTDQEDNKNNNQVI